MTIQYAQERISEIVEEAMSLLEAGGFPGGSRPAEQTPDLLTGERSYRSLRNEQESPEGFHFSWHPFEEPEDRGTGLRILISIWLRPDKEEVSLFIGRVVDWVDVNPPSGDMWPQMEAVNCDKLLLPERWEVRNF